MKTKKEIRKFYKNIIKSKDLTFVCEDIRDIIDCDNIGIYLNIKNEISLDNIIGDIKASIYVPYMKDDGSSLIKNALFEFHKYEGVLCFDDFNIPSSNGPCIDVDMLDVVICPGICFNKKGYRLGYGAACYDKILANFKGKIIGVCFEDCLIDYDFQEEHDLRVDYIVTEKRLYSIKEQVYV